MGVNDRLQSNALGVALVLGKSITNEQGSFEIRALAEKISHQRVGLEQVPLIVSGSVPKSLK